MDELAARLAVLESDFADVQIHVRALDILLVQVATDLAKKTDSWPAYAEWLQDATAKSLPHNMPTAMRGRLQEELLFLIDKIGVARIR